MSEIDVASLTQQVLLAGFALGALFGAVAQRTRFCTMGAIADLVGFGDASRLRLWLWAVLVAALGTQALIVFGGVALEGSVNGGRHLNPAALALGGALFGFGMVLASGCPSRALVRLGGGNLKALVVLVGVGLVAQMALRGVFALPRVELLEPLAFALAGPQDLGSWLARVSGLAPAAARAVVGAALGLPLAWWLLREREFRRAEPLLGGLALGAVVVAAWWVTGALGHLAEHPETLEPAWLATGSHRPEALSFVAPAASLLELLTLWSDRSTTLSFGAATLLGVLVGAGATALLRREFRWEGFANPRDLAQHLIGAALMGLGGVLALGCSIGQGLSGLSLLAAGSFIAVAGIVAGALAALRYQAWVIERG
ncbi:MAG TPA: YeeE/YedE family protein [Methylibium sp.]|nr:YeeE/YedE family protein [Methylibium sp.]